MALSEYEKQVLAQMEQGLKDEDPKLAHTMTSALPADGAEEQGPLSPRRIALGAILALVGLAVVVIGVSSQILWVAVLCGVAGFVLMVVGILWALRADPPRSGRVAKTRDVKPDDGGFMDRQRGRWENRGR